MSVQRCPHERAHVTTTALHISVDQNPPTRPRKILAQSDKHPSLSSVVEVDPLDNAHRHRFLKGRRRMPRRGKKMLRRHLMRRWGKSLVGTLMAAHASHFRGESASVSYVCMCPVGSTPIHQSFFLLEPMAQKIFDLPFMRPRALVKRGLCPIPFRRMVCTLLGEHGRE